MNWTLISVLAIIAVFALIGMFKGFIKILFSLVSIIVVLVVTSIFAPKLTTYLKEKTTWDDSLRTKTEAYYEEKGVLKHADGEVDLSDLPLPSTLRDSIAKNADSVIDKGYEAYNDYVVDSSSNMFFSIIVYIGMFLALYLLLGIVSIILNIMSRLPVIHQINKLAGFITGALEGLLIVWVLFLILGMFSNHGFAAEVYSQINANAFLTFLYDKNILLHIIIGFFG